MDTPDHNSKTIGMPLMQPANLAVVAEGTGHPAWEPSNWSTSLYECQIDVETCLLGWLLPCVMYGKNNKKLNKSGIIGPCCVYMLCGGCPCIVGGPFRSNLRNRFNINGDATTDCLAHCFCPCCSIVQEARELNFRENMAQEKGLPFQKSKQDLN